MPRGLVSATVVATQVAAAAFLLGQAMSANVDTVDEWRAWARSLQWGVTLSPGLWNGLTVLLLRGQKNSRLNQYLRWVGYPLAVLFVIGGVALTVAIYLGDSLYVWSAPVPLAADSAAYFHFRGLPGPLYPALIALVIGATLGALVNVWVGWRHSATPEQQRHFGWLFLSAGLFLLGSGPTTVASLLAVEHWPTWLGHLTLAAGQTVLVANVTAYSFFLQGKVIRTDFFYFLTSMGVLAVLYALVFAVAGPADRVGWLGFAAVTLMLVIFSHAMVDVGRRLLDRLFFAEDVRHLRSGLSEVVQDAAMTKDIGPLLTQAQTDIQEVTIEHNVRLVEEALRRLNDVAALARCRLIARLPRTLDAARGSPVAPSTIEATPLEQARALRDVLRLAIERLNPEDGDATRGTLTMLHYTVLREEYVLGTPNKQIMRRHDLSEGTFHRARRAAIAIVTGEIMKREAWLTESRE